MIKPVVISSSTLRDMNRWINTLLSQFTIEPHFHVTSSLELLKDNLVHFTFCFHQGSRKNGQASAFFTVTRRAEELTTLLQGRWTQTT